MGSVIPIIEVAGWGWRPFRNNRKKEEDITLFVNIVREKSSTWSYQCCKINTMEE
jgi:hypothetical protein